MFRPLTITLARRLGLATPVNTSVKSSSQNRFRPVLEHCEERAVPAVVGGVVWPDANATDVPDSGEGVAGLEVTLIPSAGQAIGTTTNVDGADAFVGVAPGPYIVALSTATGDAIGSVSYVGDATAVVAAVDALNLFVVRPKAEIEADIALARLALVKADFAVELAKAQQETLGIQVTKADDRVTALTKEFGANPTDAQKAQIAEAKVAADRIYKDYEAKGAEVVRAIKNREGVVAMLKELEKELNRKFD